MKVGTFFVYLIVWLFLFIAAMVVWDWGSYPDANSAAPLNTNCSYLTK